MKLALSLILSMATLASAAPGRDQLYRATLLQAAPGRLLELIEEVRPSASERRIVLRHSQGDFWDLMLLEPLAGYATQVSKGIEQVNDASVALIKDPSYALLSARAVAEMVIQVIIATELLRQAQADPRREELAARWVNLKLLELEMHAKRVSSGDVSRVERSEHIIALFD